MFKPLPLISYFYLEFVQCGPSQVNPRCSYYPRVESCARIDACFEQSNTWDLAELPQGENTVGYKLVFTVKYWADGSIERYNVRLLAKGFIQTYGIDYTETFVPVAKLNTVRILLFLATYLDWPLHQLDIKNDFLNGELEDEVYTSQSPGFEEKLAAIFFVNLTSLSMD